MQRYVDDDDDRINGCYECEYCHKESYRGVYYKADGGVSYNFCCLEHFKLWKIVGVISVEKPKKRFITNNTSFVYALWILLNIYTAIFAIHDYSIWLFNLDAPYWYNWDGSRG